MDGVKSELKFTIQQVLALRSAPFIEAHAWAVAHQALNHIRGLFNGQSFMRFTICDISSLSLQADGAALWQTVLNSDNHEHVGIGLDEFLQLLGNQLYDALSINVHLTRGRKQDDPTLPSLSPALENFLNTLRFRNHAEPSNLRSQSNSEDQVSLEQQSSMAFEHDKQCAADCLSLLHICQLRFSGCLFETRLDERRVVGSVCSLKCADAQEHYATVCRTLYAQTLSNFSLASPNYDVSTLDPNECGEQGKVAGGVQAQRRRLVKPSMVDLLLSDTGDELTATHDNFYAANTDDEINFETQSLGSADTHLHSRGTLRRTISAEQHTALLTSGRTSHKGQNLGLTLQLHYEAALLDDMDTRPSDQSNQLAGSLQLRDLEQQEESSRCVSRTVRVTPSSNGDADDEADADSSSDMHVTPSNEVVPMKDDCRPVVLCAQQVSRQPVASDLHRLATTNMQPFADPLSQFVLELESAEADDLASANTNTPFIARSRSARSKPHESVDSLLKRSRPQFQRIAHRKHIAEPPSMQPIQEPPALERKQQTTPPLPRTVPFVERPAIRQPLLVIGRNVDDTSLDLTLEEIAYMQRIANEAELETLSVDHQLYELVTRGAMCFNCLKTRLGLLFERGTPCRVCLRRVCQRCTTSLRVPDTPALFTLPVVFVLESSVTQHLCSTLDRVDSRAKTSERKQKCGAMLMNVCLTCFCIIVDNVKKNRLDMVKRRGKTF